MEKKIKFTLKRSLNLCILYRNSLSNQMFCYQIYTLSWSYREFIKSKLINNILGDKKAAQSIKCLPCKQQDRIYTLKKMGVVATAYNLNIGESETGKSLVFSDQPAYLFI